MWSQDRSHHPLTHLWPGRDSPSQLRQTLTLSVPGLTHTWQQALVVWQKDQTLKCLYRGSSSVRGTQHDSGTCLRWLTVGKHSGRGSSSMSLPLATQNMPRSSQQSGSATSHCVRHSPFSSSFPRYLLPPSHKASMAFLIYFFPFFKKISKISDRGMSGTTSADSSTSSSEYEICYKHTSLQPAAPTGSA